MGILTDRGFNHKNSYGSLKPVDHLRLRKFGSALAYVLLLSVAFVRFCSSSRASVLLDDAIVVVFLVGFGRFVVI